MNEQLGELLCNCKVWYSAYETQRLTLLGFYDLCAGLLDQACALRPLDEEVLSMERNLFSTVFIMATAALGLPAARLRFYAMVNQCLRTLVTGCDNILDDEYKEVIPLRLDGDGRRFRSVLQIMTADAVLAKVTGEELAAGRMSAAAASRVSPAVLAALIPSGVQEHEEESRSGNDIPTPETMLKQVHFRKTGLLFEAPLRIVERVGDAAPERVNCVASALARLGTACQILDDLQDVGEDVARRRSNLVLSIAYHGGHFSERKAVRELTDNANGIQNGAAEIGQLLSRALFECRRMAGRHFQDAYEALSNTIPGFGLREAAGLGALIQKAIMRNRNDLTVSLPA
ncbi:MAG: polyprenyl synthetase family protein [Candidatus Hydrogenedentes bacterium]|nr:polyprenyl synthetase family protein [Candidatus Hydrogenedentota bacterium]